MNELTAADKIYNKWWMSVFDAKKYKIIQLYSFGKKLYEYTTANSNYSDQEDLRCAVLTAKQKGIRVDEVAVHGKHFKVNHRMYQSGGQW